MLHEGFHVEHVEKVRVRLEFGGGEGEGDEDVEGGEEVRGD